MSLINRLRQALRMPVPAVLLEPETRTPGLDPDAARAALFAGWELSYDLFGIPRHWTMRLVEMEGENAGECEAQPEYGQVLIALDLSRMDTVDFLCLVIAHELCHAADSQWLGAMNQLSDILTGTNQRATHVILANASELAVQQRLQSAPGQELIAHIRAAYLAALEETP